MGLHWTPIMVDASFKSKPCHSVFPGLPNSRKDLYAIFVTKMLHCELEALCRLQLEVDYNQKHNATKSKPQPKVDCNLK